MNQTNKNNSGGKRCKVEQCTKSAVGGTQLCTAHGYCLVSHCCCLLLVLVVIVVDFEVTDMKSSV